MAGLLEKANHDGERMRMPAPLRVVRSYVTDFVNRHDFTVLSQIMVPEYTLFTSGWEIAGRDGPYRSAVAKQFEQFPGLVFTVHELFVTPAAVAIRFTEHGCDATSHAAASWPSIAIYEVEGRRLASCTIEQDYFSRRRQLQSGIPDPIDRPTTAPWDEIERDADLAAERAVGEWLGRREFTSIACVNFDDAATTGETDRIVEDPHVTITEIVSAPGIVAFAAIAEGELATDFATKVSVAEGEPIHIHMSGLVHVKDGRVVGGHVIRDRLGLFRRLARAP